MSEGKVTMGSATMISLVLQRIEAHASRLSMQNDKLTERISRFNPNLIPPKPDVKGDFSDMKLQQGEALLQIPQSDMIERALERMDSERDRYGSLVKIIEEIF